MNKWISVQKKTPPFDKEILVKTDEEIYVGKLSLAKTSEGEINTAYYKSGFVFVLSYYIGDYDDTFDGSVITHWAELPAESE